MREKAISLICSFVVLAAAFGMLHPGAPGLPTVGIESALTWLPYPPTAFFFSIAGFLMSLSYAHTPDSPVRRKHLLFISGAALGIFLSALAYKLFLLGKALGFY